MGPAELEPLVPERATMLARLASPGRLLREKTVGQIPRLPEPDRGVRSTGQGEVILTFDPSDPTWRGYSATSSAIACPPGRVGFGVLARGSGRHAMTPVTLPAGLALAVQVESTDPGNPLRWSARSAVGSAALIAMKGGAVYLGSLLRAVRSTRPGAPNRRRGGRLDLNRCWLRGDEPGGALLAIESAGAGHRSASLARLVDCTLTSAGDALSAEIGRGILDLENFAIASGEHALVLLPVGRPGGVVPRRTCTWIDAR